MEEDDEGNFHGNNRSPGSQGSAGWEVEQGMQVLIFCFDLPCDQNYSILRDWYLVKIML